MKPYAADTPADWMDVTASEWFDRYLPSGWRERSYGDLLRASPSDWLGWVYPQYASAPSAPAWAKSPLYDTRRHARPHPAGCRCRECEKCRRCSPDSCECFCCIGDVDLVVYARVGEQRVIPIVVENERRREKSITVELSPWRSRGGAEGAVETVSVDPKTFTLAPCGEHEVTIVVRVPQPQGQQGDAATTGRRQQDVDACVVVTSDLTLAGCDHRPIRIAIAILPRDCEPYRVPCGCGCC